MRNLYVCLLLLLCYLPLQAQQEDDEFMTEPPQEEFVTEEETEFTDTENEVRQNNIFTPEEQQQYRQQPVPQRDFSREDWEKVTKGINFNEKVEKPKEEKTETKTPELRAPQAAFNFSQTLKILLFVVVIVLLAFLLIRILGGYRFLSNRRVDNSKNLTIEQIEENIHESDLEAFLRQALQQGEYKMAIRIYYLMIIKELSYKDLIHWKKDKTNLEYLREMRQHAQYQNFRELTRLFEYIWYGDAQVQQNDYERLSPQFSSFMQQIKGKAA